MCGIAGIVNWGDREVLSQMVACQVHRGPDDGGVWEKRCPDGTYIGLGSRRLSIIDLSSDGHMPMSTEDGRLCIAYNGEVYNFPELREELIAKGCRFKSRTDTEVILRLYEREGPDCVHRLNGMFAFAISDTRGSDPVLFLARDHFGVKPLYYTQRGNALGFASEIKALLALPGFERAIDYDALNQYLTFLWVPDPATLFKDVLKLPPGHCATFRNGKLTISQYWDLEFPPAGSIPARSEADLQEETRERLHRAVKRQMIADVPIGVFLSAGLDSSTIAALVAQESTKPVRTYTITFPDKFRVGENRLDDPRVAARFAKRLGCEHHEMVVGADAAQLLPRLVWHMDEPTADPAIITAYLVCNEASRDVKVLLSGVGGDEIFAGYRKHYAQRWAVAYRKLPQPIRSSFQSLVSALPSLRGTSLKGAVRLANKMARSASLDPEDAFLMNSVYLDAPQVDQLCTPETRARMSELHPWRTHREYFALVKHADFLNQMLYLDTKAFMVSLNLTYNDKMSMAASVEARVPFLDRELAEFAAAKIPPDMKLRGFLKPTTKYILRKAMEEHLSAEILTQPKAGFFAPIDHWLASDLRPMLDELLSESSVRRRGLFRPEAVRNLIAEHRSGARDWSMQIFQLLTLELWMQTFLDTSIIHMSLSAPVATAPQFS